MNRIKHLLKALLSSVIWGLGQLLNRQYFKALFFFAMFCLFFGIEFGSEGIFPNLILIRKSPAMI